MRALVGVRPHWLGHAGERIQLHARRLASLEANAIPHTADQWRGFAEMSMLLAGLEGVFLRTRRPALAEMFRRSGLVFLHRWARNGWRKRFSRGERRWAMERDVTGARDFINAVTAAVGPVPSKPKTVLEVIEEFYGAGQLIKLAEDWHSEPSRVSAAAIAPQAAPLLVALAGLSPLRLIEVSQRWHQACSHPVADDAAAYEHITWPALCPAWRHGAVTIRELVTVRELAREGAELRHCVGSYDYLCLRSNAHVFALEDDAGGRSTLAVSVASRELARFEVSSVEHRGIRNETPPQVHAAAKHAFLVALNSEAFRAAREVCCSQGAIRERLWKEISAWRRANAQAALRRSLPQSLEILL